MATTPIVPVKPAVISTIKPVLETKTVEKTEKETVLDQIQTVLAEYKFMESNIPLTHKYWDLLNKYRSL